MSDPVVCCNFLRSRSDRDSSDVLETHPKFQEGNSSYVFTATIQKSTVSNSLYLRPFMMFDSPEVCVRHILTVQETERKFCVAVQPVIPICVYLDMECETSTSDPETEKDVEADAQMWRSLHLVQQLLNEHLRFQRRPESQAIHDKDWYIYDSDRPGKRSRRAYLPKLFFHDITHLKRFMWTKVRPMAERVAGDKNKTYIDFCVYHAWRFLRLPFSSKDGRHYLKPTLFVNSLRSVLLDLDHKDTHIRVGFLHLMDIHSAPILTTFTESDFKGVKPVKKRKRNSTTDDLDMRRGALTFRLSGTPFGADKILQCAHHYLAKSDNNGHQYRSQWKWLPESKGGLTGRWILTIRWLDRSSDAKRKCLSGNLHGMTRNGAYFLIGYCSGQLMAWLKYKCLSSRCRLWNEQSPTIWTTLL